jgi:dihydrofolate synthase/folylpolyglutamate synthase
MDGAHNPDGARVLADHALACGLRPHLVFGAMKDKDLAGVAAELRRMAPRSITFVRGEGERYADAEHLQAAWGGEVVVRLIQEVVGLLKTPADAPRLVAGSLYLLGDLLKALGIQP